jgi:hypothetical protein
MDFFFLSGDRFHGTVSEADLAACAVFINGIGDQFFADPSRASPV